MKFGCIVKDWKMERTCDKIESKSGKSMKGWSRKELFNLSSFWEKLPENCRQAWKTLVRLNKTEQ